MAEQKSPKPDGAEPEADLARLVVEKELAVREDVEACLARQKELAGGGGVRPLADLLVEQGLVTRGQLGRLRSAMEAARDQQIPGYQLLSKIDSGSMATVFKARQISLNRVVAIKVLPQRLSRDADYVKRFYREGEIAAKLNHPNIVQAIDIGEANGYHYFVMEYVEGQTVHDELAEGKVYSESEALTIIIQIAKALEYAHAAGLIHRDVKPKNIILTPDGMAKLADMGLARAVDDAAAAVAEAGTLFGTPYYISPEQITAKEADHRADIYALGATLYHMVTGRVPFQADDAKGVMLKHLKEPLVSPDRINMDLSFGICQVIKRMMAKDRAKRHATTAEMVRDLESIDFLLEAGDTPSDLGELAEEAGGQADKAPAAAPAAPAAKGATGPAGDTTPSKAAPGGKPAAAAAGAKPAPPGPAGAKSAAPAAAKGRDGAKPTYAPITPPPQRGFTMEPMVPSIWKNPVVIGILVALIISAVVNALLLFR